MSQIAPSEDWVVFSSNTHDQLEETPSLACLADYAKVSGSLSLWAKPKPILSCTSAIAHLKESAEDFLFWLICLLQSPQKSWNTEAPKEIYLYHDTDKLDFLFIFKILNTYCHDLHAPCRVRASRYTAPVSPEEGGHKERECLTQHPGARSRQNFDAPISNLAL